MKDQVILGDCYNVLRTFNENYFDTMITDPPYGLQFMGKKWDYDVPSVEIWKECLRVMKPGAFALIFGGPRTFHRMAINVEDAGFVLRDTIMWIYGSGFPKSQKIKKFKGYGTNLKPAFEPIIIAMKPNEGSFEENAEKWNVSGLNIEGSKIGNEERINTPATSRLGTFNQSPKSGVSYNGETVTGRWPSNVIFDEESAQVLDKQSGNLKSGKDQNPTRDKVSGFFGQKLPYSGANYGDEGGASRFFYVTKPPSKEKENLLGTKNRENFRPKGVAFNKKGSVLEEKKEGNIHPTVKPLELLEYLCTLTSPPNGGIVLDPFAGSGTTGIACKKTNRNFVLIEKEENYYELCLFRTGLKRKSFGLEDFV